MKAYRLNQWKDSANWHRRHPVYGPRTAQEAAAVEALLACLPDVSLGVGPICSRAALVMVGTGHIGTDHNVINIPHITQN